MGRWGKLTPEEWEEEQAWQESHPDSAGERLMDAIDDALKPPSIPDIFHEPKEEDYRGYDWGDGSSTGGDTGCTWPLILLAIVVVTFPFSLYFIVGLLAVIAIAFGLGVWGLYYLAEQLVHFLFGL